MTKEHKENAGNYRVTIRKDESLPSSNLEKVLFHMNNLFIMGHSKNTRNPKGRGGVATVSSVSQGQGRPRGQPTKMSHVILTKFRRKSL